MSKAEPDTRELRAALAEKLENILGQNYVDEYSGSDRHIGTDEIAAELVPIFAHHQKQAEIEARINELEHTYYDAELGFIATSISDQSVESRIAALKSMRDEL